jgi:putative ABC transport system substrate-binding protein
VHRRVFLGTVVGSLLVGPLAAAAQQVPGKIPVIGLLDFSTADPARLNWWQAFRRGLQELGYVEGQSIRFEARWAQGRTERLPGLAAELVGLRVDVIVTGGSEAARAAKQATATIPIVMATGSDPVKFGIVESLARPGGNVTGVSSISGELMAKRVELLRELLPKISRVAILWDETPTARITVQELEAEARRLGIGIHQVGVRGSSDFARAFSEAARARAVIVVASSFMFTERKRIADLALKHRLPTALGAREYVEAGGLFSYAVSFPDRFRRAAWYVDRILKGARPADLPVEQPTTFELVINLKTAKALGLTVPRSLQQRANQVIE